MNLFIPDHLIADILSRLPVKTLLRFRCACKPWRSLIADPTFIATHHKRTENHHTLLVESEDPASRSRAFSLLNTKNPDAVANLDSPFPHRGLPADLYIVCSINGIVCLSTGCLNFVALWNPATKWFRYLPRPRIVNSDAYIAIGFAFDSVRNDYKIVRIVWFFYNTDLPTRVEVFSLNAGAWREIKVDQRYSFYGCTCLAVVKGVPYWLDYRGGVFLWFDAVNEVFGMSPALGTVVNPYPPIAYCPVNYKDSFTVLSLSAEGVDLWAIEDSGGSWSKKFTVGPVFGVAGLLGCSKNGEIVVQNAEGKLVLYYPDSGEAKNVQIEAFRETWFLVRGYSESLVSF